MTTVNDVPELRTIWGMWVRCLIEFPNIPVGSLGIIDEIYDKNDGVMVAWNFEKTPLPIGYPFHERNPRAVYNKGWLQTKANLIRDGFGRNSNELIYLELLGTSLPKQD